MKPRKDHDLRRPEAQVRWTGRAGRGLRAPSVCGSPGRSVVERKLWPLSHRLCSSTVTSPLGNRACCWPAGPASGGPGQGVEGHEGTLEVAARPCAGLRAFCERRPEPHLPCRLRGRLPRSPALSEAAGVRLRRNLGPAHEADGRPSTATSGRSGRGEGPHPTCWPRLGLPLLLFSLVCFHMFSPQKRGTIFTGLAPNAM